MSKPKPPKAIPKVKKPNIKSIITGFFGNYLFEILHFIFIVSMFYVAMFFFQKQEYSLRNYFIFQVIILFIGIIHCVGFFIWISWSEKFFGVKEIVWTLLLFVIGITMINFSPVAEFLPTLPQAYVWTCIFFLVPWLFMITFELFTSIPDKYYNGWKYPYGKEVPVIEVIDPVKIKFYVVKQVGDTDYAEFELNVPKQYSLSDFMHYFLHRYNYDKNPTSPIYVSKENKPDDLYDWMFYARGANMNKNRVLDPSLSFDALSIKENENIVLERYSFGKNKANDIIVDKEVEAATVDQEAKIEENE